MDVRSSLEVKTIIYGGRSKTYHQFSVYKSRKTMGFNKLVLTLVLRLEHTP